ncbi:MAG: glycosyltransferase family 4 protein [Cyanobacteria bacterium SIG28]|nr:glycosyltransferase family 4 protein [Cyanobacteria bacterium SIG28]
MKLLFDATELSYYNDNSGHKAGVYYVALNLLRQFQNLGIDVTLYCDFKRYYSLKQIKEFENFEILKENSKFNLLLSKLIYLSRNFPIRLKYAILILIRFYDSWFYKINKKNCEQLKQFEVYFSPFSPESKEIEASGLKIFRMVHDVIPILENGYPKTPKDWHYKIYKTINDKNFYLTNSENTGKDVLKYFPFIKEENIKTTLLAANGNFYPSKDKSPIDGKYIFSLCTLGKRKNLIFAIKNFFEFINKNNIDDLKLVLGGSIWKKYESELNNVLSLYDKSKIVVTGYIVEEELRNYYSNALCFIYPSLYEGFGLPVLEAMQCGCPVITSKISSLPEVIGDCGILIDPKSDDEMQKAYEKMYFNSEFRISCSKKGLERSNQFSWEKCAREILDFISSKM